MGKISFVVTVVLTTLLTFFVFFGCTESEKSDLKDFAESQLQSSFFKATNDVDLPPLDFTSTLFAKDGSPPSAVLEVVGGVDKTEEYTWFTHYIPYELEKVSSAFGNSYSDVVLFKKSPRPFYIGVKFSKTSDEQRMAIVYNQRVLYISKRLYEEGEEGYQKTPLPSDPAFYIDFHRHHEFANRFVERRVSVYFYIKINHTIPIQYTCANKNMVEEINRILSIKYRHSIALDNKLKLCRIDFTVSFQEDYESQTPIFKVEIDFSTPPPPYFYDWGEEDFFMDGNKFTPKKDRMYLAGISKEFLVKRFFSTFYWP